MQDGRSNSRPASSSVASRSRSPAAHRRPPQGSFSNQPLVSLRTLAGYGETSILKVVPVPLIGGEVVVVHVSRFTRATLVAVFSLAMTTPAFAQAQAQNAPTPQDVAALKAQIEQLQKQIEALQQQLIALQGATPAAVPPIPTAAPPGGAAAQPPAGGQPQPAGQPPTGGTVQVPAGAAGAGGPEGQLPVYG